jgi:hypothetical protein
MLLTTLACPYCYETFTGRQIMFRCNARLSREGRRCELQPDERLFIHRGVRGDLGPAFEPGGLLKGTASAAGCPACGGRTT